MKKLILLVLVVVTFASCGKDKKDIKTPEETTPKTEEIKTEVKKVEETPKATGQNSEQVTKGEEIFKAKGCVACHQVDKKVVGPSLQEIAKVYADNKGNMVKFLKGNADAIVDKDPDQVSVMKANITGILKDFKAEELQAVTAYIRSQGK